MTATNSRLGIVDRFREHAPDDVLVSLVSHIVGGSRDAATRLRSAVETGNYSISEARDVFPYERRGCIETRLEGLPGEYPGVTVESRYNRSGNSHKIIRMAGALLTVCPSSRPGRMVRASRHRKQYASSASGNIELDQLKFKIGPGNLFVFDEGGLLRPDDELIYGVVFYQPASDNRLAVGYVGIGFPDVCYTRYLDVMDLTGLFPRAAVAKPEEKIGDLANVGLLEGVEVEALAANTENEEG